MTRWLRRCPLRGPSRDRGAAAVEFALVVPVLLLLVFGIIDFGRAYDTRIMLTEAASEAARSLAIGKTVDQAKTDARAVVDGSAVNPDDLQFPTAVRCTTTGTNTQSSVTVTMQFQFLTPVMAPTTAISLSGVGARQCAA